MDAPLETRMDLLLCQAAIHDFFNTTQTVSPKNKTIVDNMILLIIDWTKQHADVQLQKKKKKKKKNYIFPKKKK